MYDNKIFRYGSNIIEVNKINNIVNKSSNILNKTDLIISDWYKYDLLNHGSNILKNIDNLQPYINNLITESQLTVEVYHNIGKKILNGIEISIYISIISFFIILTIQCISCSVLVYLYREHKTRVLRLK